MTSLRSWSSLRKAIHEQLAPSLRDRVDVFVTRYRHAHDGDGRWAIRLDGQEIAALGDMVARAERYERDHQTRESGGSRPRLSGFRWAAATGRPDSDGFRRSLCRLLALPIESALESEDSVIRALALVDRRLGKRRLRSLRLPHEASDLERRLLEVRLEAEGIESNPEATPTPEKLNAAADGTRGAQG